MEEGRSRQVHRGAGLALGAQGEEQLLMGSDSAGLRQSLQSENRYLKDRVRSCEKGLLTLYQVRPVCVCVRVPVCVRVLLVWCEGVW